MTENPQKFEKEQFERMVDTVLAYRPKKAVKRKQKRKADKRAKKSASP